MDAGTTKALLHAGSQSGYDFGSGVSHASGSFLWLKSNNVNTDRGGMLVLHETSAASGGTHMTAFRCADTLASDLVYILPSAAPTAGQSLIATTVNSTPTDYTLAWGTLGVAGGGTGATTLTSGGLLYGNGTSAVAGSSYISITESATASGIKITTPSDTDSDSGFLRFEKTAAMDSGDVIGMISFYGDDAQGNTPEGWAGIYAQCDTTTNNSEDANLCFETIHNGTVYKMQHRYTGNTEYYWPSDDGGADEVLTSDGNGVLSWENIGGLSGGGENNQTITTGTGAQTGITSVVNTSLEIGRDADNRIKFGTDNQIIFEVSGGDNVIFKASGEIEATSLDIGSGGVDVNGTLEANTLTVGGTNVLTGSLITTLGTISSGVWNGTAITASYIGADAITAAKIGDNVINSEHYAAGSIDNEHLAANSVDSSNYVDDSIDTAHYAAVSVDTTALGAD